MELTRKLSYKGVPIKLLNYKYSDDDYSSLYIEIPLIFSLFDTIVFRQYGTKRDPGCSSHFKSITLEYLVSRIGTYGT